APYGHPQPYSEPPHRDAYNYPADPRLYRQSLSNPPPGPDPCYAASSRRYSDYAPPPPDPNIHPLPDPRWNAESPQQYSHNPPPYPPPPPPQQQQQLDHRWSYDASLRVASPYEEPNCLPSPVSPVRRESHGVVVESEIARWAAQDPEQWRGDPYPPSSYAPREEEVYATYSPDPAPDTPAPPTPNSAPAAAEPPLRNYAQRDIDRLSRVYMLRKAQEAKEADGLAREMEKIEVSLDARRYSFASQASRELYPAQRPPSPPPDTRRPQSILPAPLPLPPPPAPQYVLEQEKVERPLVQQVLDVKEKKKTKRLSLFGRRPK
ncbi:hypothetical protein BDK51DRAFT_38240, partial [Blyttiomyces helicus]